MSCIFNNTFFVALSFVSLFFSQTLTGAQNRARNVAAALPDCDFHIGIEGGIETLVNPADPAQKRYFESGYIYVVRASDGKDSVGTSARFEMAPVRCRTRILHEYRSATMFLAMNLLVLSFIGNSELVFV